MQIRNGKRPAGNDDALSRNNDSSEMIIIFIFREIVDNIVKILKYEIFL